MTTTEPGVTATGTGIYVLDVLDEACALLQERIPGAVCKQLLSGDELPSPVYATIWRINRGATACQLIAYGGVTFYTLKKTFAVSRGVINDHVPDQEIDPKNIIGDILVLPITYAGAECFRNRAARLRDLEHSVVIARANGVLELSDGLQRHLPDGVDPWIASGPRCEQSIVAQRYKQEFPGVLATALEDMLRAG